MFTPKSGRNLNNSCLKIFKKEADASDVDFAREPSVHDTGSELVRLRNDKKEKTIAYKMPSNRH